MKKLFFVILFAFLLSIPMAVLAEEGDLGTQCAKISDSSDSCNGLGQAECQALLKKCADYYDQQSAEIAKDLTKTTQQKSTLQSQVSTLKKKIQNLDYQISQGNMMVKDLRLQISDTQVSIEKTSSKIDESRAQIVALLREINQEDKKSSFEILLEGNLSDFFNNIVYLEGLNSKLSGLLDNTISLKGYLEGQKQKMDEEKSGLEQVVKVQSLQKQESEQNKKQQETYLKLTEAQYQQQLKDKQDIDKKAASIKARIFDILGVSKAPTFGEAYKIAKYVSGITGVRPAFLLAILTQESNIGKNVGQCYVANYETGAGVDSKGSAKTRVMNPKSIPSFVELTTSLGMDPKKTPVSCWIPLYSNGAPYGWGGAMGPAQFIASTWNMYKDKVAQITGRPSNPWNINDAFLASGLLLKDNGAATNEFKAAMRYFSGGSWTKAEEFYGRSVISIAAGYADDIAAIEASN